MANELTNEQLNALIGERVMGWHLGKTPEVRRGEVWLDRNGKWVFCSEKTFNPTSDLADLVHAVMNKAMEDSVVLELCMERNTTYVWVEAWFLHDIHHKVSAKGKTIARAVCEAIIQLYPLISTPT